MYRLDQLIAALAREAIWLTDAYFVGTTSYVQALRAAAADGVQLAWGTVSGLTARVRIYRYERGAAPRVLAEVPADPPGYLDGTARAGVRYYYYLTFVMDGVEGPRTDELSARR